MEEMKPLSKKVVKGFAWIALGKGLEQLLLLAKLILVARFLTPYDVGLWGIALLVFYIVEILSQLNFQHSLIQKPGEIQKYLNIVWTVLILRGLVIALVLYLTAPFAANFFSEPSTELLIKALCLVVLFQSFSNVATISWQKELEFNKQFIQQAVGTFVDFLTTVTFLILLKSVWALAFGFLLKHLTQFFISYILHSYRPRLSNNFGSIKELFHFEKWLWVSGILMFLFMQGDHLIVGKFLGIAALGFYQLAYRISNTPATELTWIISQTTLPAYSKLQDNVGLLKDGFEKVLNTTMLLCLPLCGLIFIMAYDFVNIFLGERWLPMVTPMRILTFFAISRSIGYVTGPIFLAVGKPRVITQLQSIRVICLLAFVFPLAFYFNIAGVSLAVTISALIGSSLAIYHLSRTIDFGFGSFLKTMVIPFTGVFFMAAGILLLKSYFLYPPSFKTFFGVCFMGALIYLTVTYFMDKALGWNNFHRLKTYLQNLI